MKAMRYKIAMVLSLLSLPAMLLVASGGAGGGGSARQRRGRCHLIKPGVIQANLYRLGRDRLRRVRPADRPVPHPVHGASDRQPDTERKRKSQDRARAMPLLRPRVPHVNGPTVTIPTVSCQPLRPGCDNISSFAGGSASVKGINAVDSASLNTTLAVGDVEPPDQGLCAGNGSVVETNNIGEILIFNKALKRASPVISLDTADGAHEAALEQRRGPVVPVGPGQRRSLVLHPDRLEEPGVQGRPVRRAASWPRPTPASRASR